MGLFSNNYTEADAFKVVDQINAEMRAISASMHLNYNMIDGRNRNTCRSHFNNIMSLAKKYEKIKNSLSDIDLAMMMCAAVDVWNGENVGLPVWEDYIRELLPQLHREINY